MKESPLLASPVFARAEEEDADVIIYGGTSSGVIAAVQAARMGKIVILIEPGRHIGGMTSSGLGWSDVGEEETIGGVAREFYGRIHQWYQDPAHWTAQTPEEMAAQEKAMQYDPYADVTAKRIVPDAMFVFEPHVTELELNRMLAEAGIRVVLGERLDENNGVVKSGTRIVSIRMESGRVFAGKVFLDCSYEGDLMARAGVKYTVGRESNATYDEKINGFQISEKIRRGDRPLDPYVVPGDPASGLIKDIEPDPVDRIAIGDADERVQSYNFRLCLTNQPQNRVPFDKPADYDERDFELLFRWMEAGNTKGLPVGFSPIPNAKTDSNKAGWVSTDYMGHANEYPDADYARREQIIADHIRYTKGFLWSLANHPRVPEDVRRRASEWGYPKDEFVDNGHFPFQLYVRECRRMLGERVMTEHEVRGEREVADPVAIGSYGMDAHPTQIWVDKDGALRADEPPWTKVEPYGISFRSLMPKADQCSNLLVPICLSASHSAYGSIRMEPVYMMLAQAAATAAALAIDEGVAIQKVDYDALRRRLVADGQRLPPAD